MADIYQQLVANKDIYNVSQFQLVNCTLNNLTRIKPDIDYCIDCASLLVKFINRTFNNFDFKAHNMCIAGGFYSSYLQRKFKDFDIYCFGNLKDSLFALLSYLRPEGVYISTNCITFYVNGIMTQVIYKKEFQAKNAYELVSNFDISACEVWYDGTLNFTARSKYTFETNIIFINQKPIHALNINRIFKYSHRYVMYHALDNKNDSIAYDGELIFTSDSIGEHNRKMLIEQKYTQLIGYIKIDNVMEQIKNGIIKFSPHHREHEYMLVMYPLKYSIYTPEERKLLNYAYMDYIEDRTLSEKTLNLFKTIYNKAMDRFPTIIHKVVL